jgi:hypothetical protein
MVTPDTPLKPDGDASKARHARICAHVAHSSGGCVVSFIPHPQK